ncbi:hypothetical protein C8R43DRAFT_297017 [Mycena crocata]|nr:hypothetical protein C8R43DRAFT_297017 [Mycena crocata]
MLSRLFQRTPAHTPAPPGVRVIPCTSLDLNFRNIVLTTGLIIDAQLNVQILEQSLSTLVEHNFPRAGARVAFRNGVYEFQIPCAFDSNTPPIIFTAEDHPDDYSSSARPELPNHITGGSALPPLTGSRFPTRPCFMYFSCPRRGLSRSHFHWSHNPAHRL